jgi:putative adenylate-forming enzyme
LLAALEYHTGHLAAYFTLMRWADLLWSYWRARRMRFSSRAELEHHQQRQMERFRQGVLATRPYFKPFLSEPFADWPLMDKKLMMEHFSAMTADGLALAEVLECAQKAERCRDFTPTIKGYSVGLSSGTSGGRGVFVVSPEEQSRWAGVLLAKVLPRGLGRRQRVALFLRANSNLYRSVRSPWLSFEFFDLFAPLASHFRSLAAYRPSIVVAPAQVLRALALAVRQGEIALQPSLVISVAEVLEAQDKALLQQVFGEVGEIYQATEGFLGATCRHGTLHLNEEYLLVEPEWLDDKRFVPIITDFTRTTQPIVRYRLDDVLTCHDAACPCGRPGLAIASIDGRCDDMLCLPAANGEEITLFADVCSRALAQSLPLDADYRLTQTGTDSLTLEADSDQSVLATCRQHLCDLFSRQGVAVERLRWTLRTLVTTEDFTIKRRRIRRLNA